MNFKVNLFIIVATLLQVLASVDCLLLMLSTFYKQLRKLAFFTGSSSPNMRNSWSSLNIWAQCYLLHPFVMLTSYKKCLLCYQESHISMWEHCICFFSVSSASWTLCEHYASCPAPLNHMLASLLVGLVFRSGRHRSCSVLEVLWLSAFALSPKESQSKGSSEMSHMSGFILKNAVILFRITAVLALLDPWVTIQNGNWFGFSHLWVADKL